MNLNPDQKQICESTKLGGSDGIPIASEADTFAISGKMLKHYWIRIKGRLKEQFLELSDDDLNYVEGAEMEFVIRIEHYTGRSRQEIMELIRSECACRSSPSVESEINF